MEKNICPYIVDCEEKIDLKEYKVRCAREWQGCRIFQHTKIEKIPLFWHLTNEKYFKVLFDDKSEKK